MNIFRNTHKALFKHIQPLSRVSVRHHNYEGDVFTRTEIQMLSQEESDVFYVETYSQMGFKLNNGFRIMGSCILFPKSVLHWNVGTAADINENTLSMFPLLEPKLDILVIGIGDKGEKYDSRILNFLRSKKINQEILPTDQACATFNFLNAEGRFVAAALIPPTFREFGLETHVLKQAMLEREKLFELDEREQQNTYLHKPYSTHSDEDKEKKELADGDGGSDNKDDKKK